MADVQRTGKKVFVANTMHIPIIDDPVSTAAVLDAGGMKAASLPAMKGGIAMLKNPP